MPQFALGLSFGNKAWAKFQAEFELNSARGQGGAFFLSCVKPGNATQMAWSAQYLNNSMFSTSRRLLQVRSKGKLFYLCGDS